MTITLAPEIEAAISAQAQQHGTTVEAIVNAALREKFVAESAAQPPISKDERMRRLRAAAIDCGVSLSNVAVSSEGLYD